MTHALFDWSENLTVALGQDVIFYLSAGLIFCLFIILSALKLFFGKQIRSIYFIVSGTVIAIESAITLSAGISVLFYAVLSAAVSLLLFIPYVLIPKKKEIRYNAQKEFIRYIDGEIKKEKEKGEETVKRDRQTAPAVRFKVEPERQKTASSPEVDFTHVKNVIDRLSYYDLSPSDKKQIKNLSETVALAENYGYSVELKEKINDGLGMLLKIMSKYKV